ncbi:MAG: hypothetical protein ACJAQ1_000604 [Flavobacterium sp.]|jgi:hypothetical protein
MKLHKVLFCLFLTTAIPVFSQIKGVIVDSKNQPIPYVSIAVANENIGTTSQDDGSFILRISNTSKTILFSALGYEKYSAKASNIQKVILQETKYPLDEVVLDTYKNKKQIVVGKIQSGGFRYSFSVNFHSVYYNRTQEMVAFPYIQKIKFYTKSKIDKANIRIRLVECNPDLSFGEEMFKQNQIVEVRKGTSSNILDLKELKLKIPEFGFYIVFEKLLVQKNKFNQEIKYTNISGEKVKAQKTQYQPDLAFVPTEINNYSYSPNGLNWKEGKKIQLENPKNFSNILMRKYDDNYLVPSIQLTLSN